MIILLNNKAKKEQVDLILETLDKQNLSAFYIPNENAIAIIETKLSVAVSPELIKTLPGVEKILLGYNANNRKIVN
jgi:hypothetical protein